MKPTSIKAHFTPVVDDRTRVLILGSLPGDASLAAGEYYAHPRNAFWPLMDTVTGQDVFSRAYSERLATLKAVGIGLWDVVASAERAGSLDSAIRSAEAADLRGLIAGLPSLRCVAFNGQKAATLGRRVLVDHARCLTLLTLPSSSPAYTRSLSEKAESWAILRDYLPVSEPSA